MKRNFLLFILFFCFSAAVSASNIHVFRTDVNGTFSPSGVAEDKTAELRGQGRVGVGDIVYFRVHQNYGNRSYYYRVDYADGKWHASVIEPQDYEIGKLQVKLMEDIERSLRDSLFVAVHSGDQGFEIIGSRGGGTRIVRPTFCDCGTVTIRDNPEEVAP